MHRFQKILIANRGEIACRINRTLQRLGLGAATVHSIADRGARHVRQIGESVEVGAAAPSESYLNIPAVIAAAKKTGAQAIHPGFGFLSENPAFVRAVEAAGLIFIGPTAETMEALGDKARGKLAAKQAGLPVVPGAEAASADPAAVAAMVKKLKPPLLLKAIAGGGGRGMALIENFEHLHERIVSAMGEAKRGFGTADLIVERYLPNVRHIEVQIAGDGLGGAIHLFERECSLQRRHQKVIEEAPAANLNAKLRAKILDGACALAAAARYRNLGTIEFIVSGDEFFFLEVNPRLQVEHPVTEEITGLDLVELQLRIADEERLPLRQKDVSVRGHAMEARVYAEDPDRDFMPSPGAVSLVELPKPPVRVEAGVESGDQITPFYDPMIAKIITRGEDREEALAEMQAALRRTSIVGVASNIAFLDWLLGLEEVRAGRMHTRLIDERMAARGSQPRPVAMEALIACAGFWLTRQRDPATQAAWTRWSEFTGYRTSAGAIAPSAVPALILGADEERFECRFSRMAPDGAMMIGVGEGQSRLRLSPLADGRGEGWYLADVDGTAFEIWCALDGGRVFYRSPMGAGILSAAAYLESAVAKTVADTRLLAPMMGRIARVNAKNGEAVAQGDVVIVMDSMKMELRVLAPCAGVLRGLGVKLDDMVERGAILAEVAAAPK